MFLNNALLLATVIELKEQHVHRDLVLHAGKQYNHDGKTRWAISVSPELAGLLLGSNIPEPSSDDGCWLRGPVINYISYLDPRSDLRHVDCQLELYTAGTPPSLTQATVDAYNLSKDIAEIFIRNSDGVRASPASFLQYIIDTKGEGLAEQVPDCAKVPGNVFRVSFPLRFKEGEFHVETTAGNLDIRQLTLVVEINWLGDDAKRPVPSDNPLVSLGE